MLFIDLIAALFHKIVYFSFPAGWSFENYDESRDLKEDKVVLLVTWMTRK
jgi:hypothetical protein